MILCVDRVCGRRIAGRFYHNYSKEATEFSDIGEMVFLLEQFYDSVNFPRQATNIRTFQTYIQPGEAGEEREKVMSDEELLKKHGDIGTFIIRVQHRQNSSWQGRVTWMDQNKTLSFRSVWELIKLIASALDMAGGPAEEERTASWEDA